jgi:PAS domain S-box-containing protein
LCTYNRTGLEGFEDGELAVLGALAADVVAALQRGELVQRVVDERQKLGDIVGRASDGIFTIAVDGTVSSWNPAMEEITGHEAEGVLGRAELGLLRPRDADGRDVIFERWAEGGTAPPAELQVLTRAGERRWLSCSYSRAAGPEGLGDSLVVIARDVTKVREVERLREDFVATVSHELRTPLAPIKGWASTLLQYGDRLDEDERQSAMQSILRQAQRLERLIVNLLEVSKIEHGVFEVPDADADVEVVVGRVVGDFQAASPGRHFDVAVRGPLWARAKELWLEQILTNLVSNAVKYSPETEAVEIAVCRRSGRIQVSVTDNGYGIPTHDLERVFERFYRVRETTTQTGTGLGLYIARQLAKEMDGTISVESVLGRGSRFLLDLPAAPRVVDVRSTPEVIGLEAS